MMKLIQIIAKKIELEIGPVARGSGSITSFMLKGDTLFVNPRFTSISNIWSVRLLLIAIFEVFIR